MSDIDDDRPLPYGWVKQFDANYNRNFYVDTKADPPRSIWVHPYKDEQFLREHPDIKEKVGSDPPKYSAPNRPPSPDRGVSSSSRSTPGAGASSGMSAAQKRGFFGKLKDKAIGTREEREQQRLREQEFREMRRRALQEELAQRETARQQALAQRAQLRSSYPGQGYQQQGYQQQYYQQSPGPGYYPSQYGPAQYGAPSYAPPARRSGFGGGIGLPLLGGLAGGLLLGEALDGFGDGGDGGGFGGDDGGDFGDGGGDFGGGDF